MRVDIWACRIFWLVLVFGADGLAPIVHRSSDAIWALGFLFFCTSLVLQHIRPLQSK